MLHCEALHDWGVDRHTHAEEVVMMQSGWQGCATCTWRSAELTLMYWMARAAWSTARAKKLPKCSDMSTALKPMTGMLAAQHTRLIRACGHSSCTAEASCEWGWSKRASKRVSE